MAGELSGLQFGTYTGMISDLKKTYDVRPVQNPEQNGNQHEFRFWDKNTDKIRGNGFKEIIEFSEHKQPKYANAVIFKDGLQYGTKAKDEKGLNIFDYIAGKNEYAIDLNGNGKVDNNEIFSGKIDLYAYKQAKESGDLNNYSEYLNK